MENIISFTDEKLSFSDSKKILEDPTKYTAEQVINAALTLKAIAFSIDDMLSKADMYLSATVADDKVYTKSVFGVDVNLKQISEESVRLTKEQKEFILKDPITFAPYISTTVVGSAVRSAVLSGRFPVVDGKAVVSSKGKVIAFSKTKAK